MLRQVSFLMAAWLVGPTALSAAEDEPDWGYSGGHGPGHWAELSEDFDICVRGRNQSPVDLVAHLDADLPELEFDYSQPGYLLEQNTGHSIQELVRPGNTLTYNGHPYELKQFHFHSPSEHTFGGAHFPMEVHFVHQDEEGQLLVLGLIFAEGEHNEAMAELPSFRRERGLDPLKEPVDYNSLIHGRSNYFLYNGSLTTPPCSEGVLWLVLKEPIIASKKQIQHYHDLLGFDNNRPVQPKNARIILE